MKIKVSKSVLMAALICGSFAPALFCATGAYAEETEDNLSSFALDEMVVTATRTLKAIENVPAAVNVVTEEEIAARNVNDIKEAVQMLPGVYMDQSAMGNVMIRGFDSTDILVLLDGLPVNSGYNNTMNWELIPVEKVARIELVKGAASSLYGGRAVAAVVNITTKDAEKKFGGSAVLSYGTDKTWKKAVSVDSKLNDKWSIGVGYEKRETNGYASGYNRSVAAKTSGTPKYEATLPRLKNGNYVYGERGRRKLENENISFNIKYDFDKDKSLKYTFTHAENTYTYGTPKGYVYDSDGKVVFSGNVKTQDGTIVTMPASGLGYLLGYDGKRETNIHTLNYKDEANKIALNLGFNDTRRDGYSGPSGNPTDPYYNGPGTDSYFPSKEYNIDFQKAWENIGKHTIVAGFNAKQESFDQKRVNLLRWKDHGSVNLEYGLYEKHGGKGRNLALFVQDEIKVTDPFTVYLGLRYDYYKKYDGYSRFINKDGSYSRSIDHGDGSYNELSPKVALEWKADDKTSYYMSYGHSFNPPPMYQVYRYSTSSSGDVMANPDLDPETSNTFEIGMKKKLSDRTSFGLSAYYVKTDDKIVYTTHTKTETTPQYKNYMNFGTEKRRGVEFELNHKFSDEWSAYLNYAWQDGELRRGNLAGTNLNSSMSGIYGIPKHLLHTGIQYKKDRWNVLLDAQYVSERQSSDEITGEYGSEDSFFLMNLAVNYTFAKNATLQVGINNILDREFYCSDAASGRHYTVGMRYNF